MRGSHGGWLRCAVAAILVVATLLTGCSRDPNVRKQKYLESGERYFDKGQYREAAIQFQNAIQVDPRFAEAHYRLAETALKLQQGQGALQEFITAIQINPDHYKARIGLANLAITASHLPDAKEQIDWLLQNQPNNPESYLLQATYDHAIKDTSGALTALRKALQLDPNNSDSYMALGMLEAEGGQWDEAETNLKKAVELAPKSAGAKINLGDFYKSRGRFPEAEDAYQRAIRTAPDDPNARMALGNLYLAENKPQQVEDFLRASKKDFSNNSVGYCMLGNYLIATNQMDKALTEYASLYQDHPRDPMVKNDYIQLLILHDRLDEARKLNDEVLKAQPADEQAAIHKAQIEIRGGKPSMAVDTLQSVIKNDPDNAVAHYQLGLAFDQLGTTNRAEAEWREAVRLRPDIIEAHGALARAAMQRNDASALAQEGDQIIALQPAAPDGYLLRGMAEFQRKQYTAADHYLNQAIEKAPIPEAYVQLGNLRMAENQPAEAQKAYQQALDHDPNSGDGLAGVVTVELNQKQGDKALATVKEYLAKSPNNSAFHMMLGDLLQSEKNDLAGAEDEYKRAVALNKNNVPALLKLGILQRARGENDAALQTYQDAAQNNPKVGTFYVLAGGIYESRQDWEHAKQMYQKALALQPDDPIASNNLAYVMLQQGGNLDVAFAMAQTARRQMPDNPGAADTLGWAFYQKHVYTSAIGLFQEAVKKEPGNATYNYHLGMAYVKNGQASLARQQLDRLVKIKPNGTEAEDLRRALSELKG
jgi:tetratricopeptide (TPR) repeat protein